MKCKQCDEEKEKCPDSKLVVVVKHLLGSFHHSSGIASCYVKTSTKTEFIRHMR